MQKRDLIKDQIEQLGKVLGEILSSFLRLKTEGNAKEAIQQTTNEFLVKLSISIEELVDLNNEELADYLGSKNLVDTHLDQLAAYLVERGVYAQEQEKSPLRWYTAAKKVVALAEEKSETITFERMDLKARIDKELAG